MTRLGLRGRLGVALAGVAIASVALSTVLANGGLESRLDESAQARLRDTASHLAQVAGALYAREKAWTPSARSELAHLAAIDAMRVQVDGERRGGSLTSSVPVVVEGATVARLVVTPDDPAEFRQPRSGSA